MDAQTRKQLIQMAADGELSEDQVVLLEQHLKSVPEDRVAIRNEQVLRAAVKRVLESDVELDRSLRDRIVSAFAEYEERAGLSFHVHAGQRDDHATSSTWRRRPWFIPSGLAAGILIIIGASIIVGTWPRHTGAGGRRETAHKLWEQTRQAMRNISYSQAEAENKDVELAESLLRVHTGMAELPNLTSDGFEFAEVLRQGYVDGSTALVYRDPEISDRFAVLWLVPAGEDQSDLSELMEPGQAYRVMGRMPGGGSDDQSERLINGCFAWHTSSASFLFRLADGGTSHDEDLAIQLALQLGMPTGHIVDLP